MKSWCLAMCEILAVTAEHPLKLGALLAWASELERLGIAGFGWGVAWAGADGEVHCHRNPSSLAGDVEGMLALRDTPAISALVHLRRPSRLSTVQEADTQPFCDEAGRFAFVHNGSFERDGELRDRFAGKLRGRADSEVGFRLYQSLLEDEDPLPALVRVHRTLGGTANLCVLLRGGQLALYAAHPHNAMRRFQLDGLSVACTSLHSDDESVFDLVFPEAGSREVLDDQIDTLITNGPALITRPSGN
jgi:glucosamine 6-phosphate synthetase-like amidotransferase/phosphosugar isomerase protein